MTAFAVRDALDTAVAAFRARPLTGEHRYEWVDATYHKVRVDGRVVSQATVVAAGVTTEGDLRGDCVREERRNWCGRLRKPFCGFQAAVDGALPSTAAAASTPWSNSRKARAIYNT